MNPAIFYHPEGYTTSGPKLMGRNAAGESFLRGFLTHGRNREFWLQVERREHARQFAATAQSLGRSEPVNVVERSTLRGLTTPGLIYYPGPGIGTCAWQRANFGHGSWSLCGITHTTSSIGAMDAIAELLTAPVQPWDALICTSRAVTDNVSRVLQAQADYLNQRLGITKVTLPALPVIPLGIHTQDFVFDEAQRAAARAELGIDAETLVVLYVGRLSFHAKAHPLAMYQALEAAAQASGKRVVLVECGWHGNQAIADSYAEAARLACPSVRTVTLDGREAAARQTAWAAGDVFCSLSDNIQETFGITPIEAMAAGLPVVVSDWDGYKDTVRDGVDGFRLPTLMPGAGLGRDLALNHALETETYDRYCGYACMLTAVDVGAAAEAFRRLFASPELRASMGAAGRQRAQSDYDWAAIIPRYETLWEELDARRRSDAPALAPLAHPWPARLDPFHAFATYPTATLTRETRLSLARADAPARLDALGALAMNDFAKTAIPPREELAAMLAGLAEGARTAGELVAPFPAERRPFALRGLGYLAKLGLVRRA